MNKNKLLSEIKNFLLQFWNVIGIAIINLFLLPLALSQYESNNCIYIICVISLLWITKIINITVTSLLPIILFPMFGILTPLEVASCYMKDIIMMMIGSLIVTKAIEKQNVPSRIALRILLIVGPNPIFQVLGFMISSWFLSMWINNTATTTMMVTLVSAMIVQWKSVINNNNKNEEASMNIDDMVEYKEMNFNGAEEDMNMEMLSQGLYLSIAYSAACGGIATLFGTGPNYILYGFMEERYGSNSELNYGSYMLFAFPLSIIFMFAIWIILCLKYIGIKKIFRRNRNRDNDCTKMNLIKEQYQKLGSMKCEEKVTLFLFCLLVLLWMLRVPIISLWCTYFNYKNKYGKEKKYWSDATSAIFVSILMLIIPSRNPFKRLHTKGEIPKLIDWQTIESGINWGLIFLFGGGFALAEGCSKSGLSQLIGQSLRHIEYLPEFVILFAVIVGTSFLTEITSNVATSAMLLPIMLNMADCIKIHPIKMALASCIASSFSFCLPSATPPNAIIFNKGDISVIDMITSGLLVKFVCIIVLSIMSRYYSTLIFKMEGFSNLAKINCSGF